jgi:hypothetical protein
MKEPTSSSVAMISMASLNFFSFQEKKKFIEREE